jgi:transcriptional regulator with GAF, ATPase, and Fis domain
LAKYFVDEYAKTNRLKVTNLKNDAKQKIKSYSFPGNIRELKTSIELA